MGNLAKSQKGFTLVELLIATSIFAVMMLIATSGILYIGRIYYKGVIVTKTQDASRAIVEDISRNIQTGGNKTIVGSPGVICVGQVRYSYVLDKQLSPTGAMAANQSRHILWADRVKPNVACPPVANMNTPETDVNRDPLVIGREMAGNNMRLTKFNVSTNNYAAKPIKLEVRLVYGDFELSPPPENTCISSRFGGQFCASAELTTFVKNRL